LKGQLMNFKQTGRTQISETCIGISLNLRRVANLELI
jgi:hypothetical protein